MKYETPMSGTLRIKNPKTLQKWEDSGKLTQQAEFGWIFAKKCGRFKKNICHCASCRRGLKATYYGKNGWFEMTQEELNKLKNQDQ